MRRHLTIIPLILWAFCGFAQNFSPLSESFEGIFPPQGWTNLHVSGTPQWSQTNTLEYCAGAQEGANYVMVGFGQNDNYLITPKLYPQIGDSIVFYMGIESPNYNIDNFTTVEVSTTGTAPADFTTVRNLTVADFTMGGQLVPFCRESWRLRGSRHLRGLPQQSHGLGDARRRQRLSRQCERA